MFSLLEKFGDARIKEVILMEGLSRLPCIQTMILRKKCSPALLAKLFTTLQLEGDHSCTPRGRSMQHAL
jgi:hypothetical protein